MRRDHRAPRKRVGKRDDGPARCLGRDRCGEVEAAAWRFRIHDWRIRASRPCRIKPCFGDPVQPEEGPMASLIERSRMTVEELLASRHTPRPYEERCRYAMDLVDMHLYEENPE